ncbi:MAG: hypothetical protein NT069_32470 [Planctomycetota bacterium]|nr:hypothetical protein [Planctomycetota bacterium]
MFDVFRQEAAAVAFGLDWTPELTTAVSVIDKALLATELRDLVNKSASEVDQEIGILPLPLSLYPVSCADWGRLWQDRLEWALYEENEEFDPDEMPQQYADTDQEFAWRATRRRIADDIKARLAALVELDPTPVDVKNPPLS